MPSPIGALTHDDRIDAVAGALAHFRRALMMDVDQAAKAMRDEEMNAEIEDFLEGFNQPTYPRHAGQWGSGADLEQPAGHEWAVEANFCWLPHFEHLTKP
jgi:hypothetical protein